MIKYAPYSQSKIDTFVTCPMRYKLQYIDKIKFTSDPFHLVRGRYIHYCLELPDIFLAGSIDRSKFDLPTDELDKCDVKVKEFMQTSEYKQLAGERLIGNELQIGMTTKFEPANFWKDKTDPNAQEPLYRGVIDKLTEIDETTAHISDYKSGKYKELYDQLAYYSVWVFKRYPQYVKIKLSFYFIDAGMQKHYWVFKDDWKKSALLLAEKVQKIEKESCWNAKVTGLCKYCPYSRIYGDGSCQA